MALKWRFSLIAPIFSLTASDQITILVKKKSHSPQKRNVSLWATVIGIQFDRINDEFRNCWFTTKCLKTNQSVDRLRGNKNYIKKNSDREYRICKQTIEKWKLDHLNEVASEINRLAKKKKKNCHLDRFHCMHFPSSCNANLSLTDTGCATDFCVDNYVPNENGSPNTWVAKDWCHKIWVLCPTGRLVDAAVCEFRCDYRPCSCEILLHDVEHTQIKTYTIMSSSPPWHNYNLRPLVTMRNYLCGFSRACEWRVHYYYLFFWVNGIESNVLMKRSFATHIRQSY